MYKVFFSWTIQFEPKVYVVYCPPNNPSFSWYDRRQFTVVSHVANRIAGNSKALCQLPSIVGSPISFFGSALFGAIWKIVHVRSWR